MLGAIPVTFGKLKITEFEDTMITELKAVGHWGGRQLFKGYSFVGYTL